MIKQECEAPGSDNDELYYDAEAEERDQALESEMPSNKDEYYRNNQIVGVASGWKCRSLIPIHQFIRMLEKNCEQLRQEKNQLAQVMESQRQNFKFSIQ